MRALLIASLILLIQSQPPGPTPGKTNKENQDETAIKNTERKGDKQASRELSTMLDNNGSAPTPKHQKDSCNQHDGQTPSNGWAISVTVLTLIFAGALAVLAYLQWRAMRKQASYMRRGLIISMRAARASSRAAEAAKVSADALKSAERAWVLAQIDDSALRQESSRGDTATRIVCNIENCGRTLASVGSFTINKEQIALDGALPDEPNYGSEETWPNGLPLPPHGAIHRPLYLSVLNRRSAEEGANLLYVYGRIIYSDTYGDSHETRFCYRFRPRWREVDPKTAGFEIDGPPAYNRAT